MLRECIYPPSGWCIVGGTHTVEDWTECTPVHLSGRNDVLFAEKCIWLMCEKLTVFPYGQDIVGNVILLAFWWYSQVKDRSGVLRELYKNVTVISRQMDLLQHTMQWWRHGDPRPIHALFIDWVWFLCSAPSHRVCKAAYLVPVPSQDKLGGLCQEGHLA